MYIPRQHILPKPFEIFLFLQEISRKGNGIYPPCVAEYILASAIYPLPQHIYLTGNEEYISPELESLLALRIYQLRLWIYLALLREYKLRSNGCAKKSQTKVVLASNGSSSAQNEPMAWGTMACCCTTPLIHVITNTSFGKCVVICLLEAPPHQPTPAFF